MPNFRGMLILNRTRGPGEARRQADALEAEGVTVGTSSMGELTVDFRTYGWFPEGLEDDD